MNLSIWIFLLLPYLSWSFTVLPYIQIDFAHYFRLAQCQAKCTEKYGTVGKKMLNDGSTYEFFNITSDEVQFCEMGCQQNRRSKKLSPQSKEALFEGIRFWGDSAANSSKVGTSPLSSVELLCQSSTSLEGDFDDSITGRLGLVKKRGSTSPTRYIIQWRQRTFTSGLYDETQWITASIEGETLINVDGIIPGVQYRFQVTAVGPGGRLGDVVTSDWIEAISNNDQSRDLDGPLITKNGYDTDHGVSALISWPRNSRDPCNYKIVYSNSTDTNTMEISIDQSPGVLIENLEFNSQYNIMVTASKSRSDEPSSSSKLQTSFSTFTCAQIHGKGSLQCPPEPVDELKVSVHSNGTIEISWKPSAEIENILSYRIEYYSTDQFEKCDTIPRSLFLKPPTTETILFVDRGCEYMLRMTNYDVLGREALIERLIEVDVDRSVIPINWKTISITSSVLIIFILFCLLRCTLSPRCKQKINEKTNPLVTDFS